MQYALEEKWMNSASSIFIIKNEDQRCLARATVMALAALLHKEFLKAAARTGSRLKPPKPQWIGNDPLLNALWKRHAFQHVKQREPRQLLLAKMLIRAAGYPDRKCGSRAWRRLQDRYLTPLGIRLVVFSRRRHASTVFHGPQEAGKNIYLYYNDAKKHVNVVLSPTSFINQNYFCHLCLKAYLQRGRHHCKMTCFRCQESDRPACVGPLQCCEDCN